MKELISEEGKKPKAYRFARLGLSEVYATFLKRVDADYAKEVPLEPKIQDEAEVFLQEMQTIRTHREDKADHAANRHNIQSSTSLDRLIRRVRVAVKRLAGRKLRKTIKRIIS